MSDPSNRELAAEAKKLGTKLGLEVSTTGLNKAKLLELVADLRAKIAAAAAPATDTPPSAAPSGAIRADSDTSDGEVDGDTPKASAEPEPEPEPEPDREAAEPAPDTDREEAEEDREPEPEPEFSELERAEPVLRVAPGKSMTTRRGLLGEGTEVRPEDFHGERADIEARVEQLIDAGALVFS